MSIAPWHQENSPLAPCPKCFLCSFHKDFVVLHLNHDTLWVASLVAQLVKNLPTMGETWVWSLGWEDPLQEGMATHSSILPGESPWTEEPGGLQFMGSRKVGHNWANKHAHFELIFVEDMRFCLGLYFAYGCPTVTASLLKRPFFPTGLLLQLFQKSAGHNCVGL